MRWDRWGAIALVASCVLAVVTSCSDDEGASGSANCSSGICGQGGGSGGAGGGVSCAWLCSPWDTQGMGDMGTRTCVDVDGCADPALKPAETATLPALDENFYRCNVEPIFDTFCAQLACHGVEPDLTNGDPGRALRTYHRGRLRILGQMIPGEPGCLNQPPQTSDSCIGNIECACWSMPHLPDEWQRNFDAARGLAMKDDGSALDSPDDSQILTQPLRGGGLPHAGIKIWSTSDTDYVTIRDWINGGTLANCGTTN